MAVARGSGARRRQGGAPVGQEPGRGRPLGENVQVEEERRRPGPDHPRLRRRHRALVHALRQPAGARPRMDRSRRHRRLAVPATLVPHRLDGTRAGPAGRHAEARVVPRHRHRATPCRPQGDCRRVGRHRGLPLQQGGGSPLRARQHHRLGQGHRRCDEVGLARGDGGLRAADRPDDTAPRRGAVATARPQVPARRLALARA